MDYSLILYPFLFLGALQVHHSPHGVPSCLPLNPSPTDTADSVKKGAATDVPFYFDYSLKTKEGCAVREYQKELAQPGLDGENYIIIAPTGSGKTLVSALVISDHLKNHQWDPVCHVVFIVNTKPLAEQQKRELDQLIPAAQVDVYTGDTPNHIADSLKENNITVCTAGKLFDEIGKNKIKFENFSLMIFDECHHTKKGHPYARLMEYFLEQRKENSNLHLPQVIGMTASPGAGDNPTLDTEKALDHLLTLAALLDATGGMHTVTKNRDELQKYSKSSSFTRRILKSRDPDIFTAKIEKVMSELELKVCNMKCHFPRWTQEYETRIQQLKQPILLSEDPKFRDEISTLNLLRCYSNALSVYMDLQQSDAIEVLEEYHDFPDDTKATPLEKYMKDKTKSLIEELKRICPRENPLLSNLKDILSETFRSNRNSRAILFVRTKKHAFSMCKWASSLKSLNITPDVITGHTRETGEGMTQVKQEEVMERFRREGGSNLLIATSVAEEGLDVPACNLVIRFLHVSNEIAKVQTEGRARAENSQGFTILCGNSKKKYQEMKNEELIMLVETILENDWFPAGGYLKTRLANIQAAIIEKRKLKAKLKEKEKQKYCSKDVELICKRCKIVACSGTDVYTIGETNFHYVVPIQEFKEKIKLKKHKNPGYVIADQVFKTHKVHCSDCEQDWGVMCVWPSNGNKFPVLKCASFIFKVEGELRSVKKWSNAPFQMEPLSTWYAAHESDEDGFSSNEEIN